MSAPTRATRADVETWLIEQGAPFEMTTRGAAQVLGVKLADVERMFFFYHAYMMPIGGGALRGPTYVIRRWELARVLAEAQWSIPSKPKPLEPVRRMTPEQLHRLRQDAMKGVMP